MLASRSADSLGLQRVARRAHLEFQQPIGVEYAKKGIRANVIGIGYVTGPLVNRAVASGAVASDFTAAVSLAWSTVDAESEPEVYSLWCTTFTRSVRPSAFFRPSARVLLPEQGAPEMPMSSGGTPSKSCCHRAVAPELTRTRAKSP